MGDVTLSWTNPADGDFVGTMIRCRADGTYPIDHNDGTLVCNRKSPPGSEDSFTHTESVINGTTYYYSAFTYDEVPNYSETAHASATPTASGPPLDTTDPTISITSPPSGSTYSTEEDIITGSVKGDWHKYITIKGKRAQDKQRRLVSTFDNPAREMRRICHFPASNLYFTAIIRKTETGKSGGMMASLNCLFL